MNKRIFLILLLIFVIPIVQAPKLVETKPVVSHTYGNTWEEVCDGTSCRRTLYSGIRYVEEDDEWKKVEEAKDLTPYFLKNYLELDPNFDIDVLALNYTYVDLNLSFDWSKWESYPECSGNLDDIKCDFKFTMKEEWTDENGTVHKYEEKFQYKWQMKDGEVKENTKWNLKGFPFNKTYSFGGNTTTIQLQDADTEILDDIVARTPTWTEIYGGSNYIGKNESIQIKINVSSTKDETITDSKMCFWVGSSYSAINSTVNVTHIDNQTWDESTILNSSFDNYAIHGAYTKTFSPRLYFQCQYSCWTCLDFDDIVKASQGFGEDNLTIRLTGMGNGLNSTERSYKHTITESISYTTSLQYGNYHSIAPEVIFASREYTTDISLRPYLNITYIPTHANYSSLSTNLTNFTIINQSLLIQVSALWEANLSQNMSHGWIYTNGTGIWANTNYTADMNGVTGGNVNWTNITFGTHGFQKGLFGVAIKANDTSQAENMTGYWYWEIPTPFNVTPTNKSMTLNTSDFDDFNITVKNMGHLQAIYNITCKQGAICNGTNFTIIYSHTDFAVSGGLNQTVLVNVTSASGLSEQLYSGNLSVKSLNTTEEYNFTLRINITTGAFGVADLINTSISLSQIEDQNRTIIFYVNNTGGASLSCSVYTSTSPPLTKTTFNDSSFTLAPNTPRWITMWTGKPAAGVYFGSLVLDCGSSTDSATLIVDSNVRAADPPGGGGAERIGEFPLNTIPSSFAQDISPGLSLARDLTILNPNPLDAEVSIDFLCSDDESCGWFSVEEAVVVVPGGNEESPGREHFKIIVDCPEGTEYGEYLTTIRLEAAEGMMLIPYRVIVTRFSFSIVANQAFAALSANWILVGIIGFLVLIYYGKRGVRK